MPTLKFLLPDGTEQIVEAENGQTVMEAAVDNMVPGIIAECGGCCSCATCHVQVDEAWAGKLEPSDDMEDDMLEFAVEPCDTSRLSCQITVTEELDGFTVRVPEGQA